MEQPLVEIVGWVSRLPDDWLIGYDNCKFSQLFEQYYLELTQPPHWKTSPKVLLADRDPVRFIAGFMAACAFGCPVFLCNPNWVKQEWQQVFDLVQPDLIWGQEASLLNQKRNSPIPNSQFPIPNSIMIPTGGSSGQIRFAIHTRETLMASVQGFRQYFQLERVNSFCVLPLYHVSGLMQFMRSLTTGGRLAIVPFKALEVGARYNINPEEFFISLVPTQLQRLLQRDPTWLSRFQTVLLGGAPAWPELLEMARYHGIRLAPTYGMTETASQIATLKPEDFLNGVNTCGCILPHAKVTIHSSAGEILGINETGIITVQADSLALGYYPEIFEKRQHFQVDDLGFIDERDHLNIVGRSSSKIITGGENVFPSEVEAAIIATGLVADVCVTGLSDRHWGQAVAAVYVPSHSAVSTDKLQTELEYKLSKFKRPKYWVQVETLPRNSQGKVNREQLQKLVMAWCQHHPTGAAIE